jgi:WD40 repeat protein
MADRVGQRLGNYRLTRLLGKGGFAEVYLGEHLRLRTQAAVKVLYTRLASPEEVAGFEKEAQTIAHLKHPHIVRVLDFDVQDDTPFLVMDYALHGTLRQRHPKGSVLPLPIVISYVKQVAGALQYAHDQKLIHRDVKPENILLGECQELLLSDFGIAAVAHSTSSLSTQAYSGTAHYSAPEQISGKPRLASDQYSLGIVVYEWLTGTRPFTGDVTQLIYQHISASPSPLREKVPMLSPEVEQVVMTALAKKPEERFANILAFAKALEQASQLKTAPLGTTLLTYRGYSKSASAYCYWDAVAWSPDGRRIASCSEDETVQVWDVVTGGLILAHHGYSSIVEWSPDGSRIASAGSDKTVQVWNAMTGGTLLTYPYNRRYMVGVQAIVWSPDGSRIASCYSDQKVQVWDAAIGSILLDYYYASDKDTSWFDDWDCDTPYPLYDISWSPDGSHIASIGEVGIEVWDTTSGKKILACEEHCTLAWSPNGRYIALAGSGETVQVRNIPTGRIIGFYAEHTDHVKAVAWSPDGWRIASGGHDGTVQVWNAANGDNIYTYHGHCETVYAVAWSPDGRRIASGGDDKTVQVWNAADGGNVYTYGGHSDEVYAVAWSPDGRRIASGSGDKTVQVWQAG